MRWLFIVLALVFMSTQPGCGSEPPKASSVYKRFFRTMVAYSRNPFSGYQKQAYEMLTRADKEVLQARAKRVNDSLSDGIRRLEPYEMLVVRQTELGIMIRESKVVERSENTTVLDVTYSEGVGRVTLRFEDGAWRVDLSLQRTT